LTGGSFPVFGVGSG